MSGYALQWSNSRAVEFAPSSGSATAQKWAATYLKAGSGSAVLSEERAKVQRLGTLRPNWDDRGGVPPSPLAVEHADSWLGPMRDASARTGRAWVRPHISASGDGEIAFEWWRGPRKITLYFGDQGVEFLKVWGAHIQDEMDSGELRTADTFRALWTWLHA